MKDSSAQHYAANIGIGWADRKHDICEIPAHADTTNRKPVLNNISLYWLYT